MTPNLSVGVTGCLGHLPSISFANEAVSLFPSGSRGIEPKHVYWHIGVIIPLILVSPFPIIATGPRPWWFVCSLLVWDTLPLEFGPNFWRSSWNMGNYIPTWQFFAIVTFLGENVTLWMVVGDLQIGDQVGSRLESPGVHPIFLLNTSFSSVFSCFTRKSGERILGPFLGICHGMWHLCDLVGKWWSISGKDLKNW